MKNQYSYLTMAIATWLNLSLLMLYKILSAA